MNNRFRNKNGDVSAYGFICGYIQERTIGKLRVKLYQEAGARFYQVIVFYNDFRIKWETLETLKSARAEYRSAIREHRPDRKAIQ